VPNVKATTLRQAKGALKARGCAAGKIKVRLPRDHCEGRVIAQSKQGPVRATLAATRLRPSVSSAASL
jgi:hypothetical protein